jgi:hypothetical protein
MTTKQGRIPFARCSKVLRKQAPTRRSDYKHASCPRRRRSRSAELALKSPEPLLN